jgi:GntR family transcriptional regulator
MFLKIDPKSGIPIYLQIVEQIKWQTASGRLLQGDQVPTVREMASSLRVNPNTVAKSYRELEREGILEGRPGQGSFIAGVDSGLSLDKKLQIVSRAMEPPLVQAFHLQLDVVKVRDVFERKLVEIYREDYLRLKGDGDE